MSVAEMVAAVRASSLSELSWLAADRRPSVVGVVALTRQDRPVVAFTYADEAVARAVAESSVVALSLTDPRSTGSVFRSLLVRGRPSLVEDPSGAAFTEHLLSEELRRYPPARVYADSPLLRREHWWFLPRLLIEIDVSSVEQLPSRQTPRDHVLAVDGPDGPVVRVVRIDDEHSTPDRLSLTLLGQASPPAAGSAVLFGQDASFPDLEQWSQWCFTGAWHGSSFTVEEAPARVGLVTRPSVLQRWRTQRELERRCRAAIPR